MRLQLPPIYSSAAGVPSMLSREHDFVKNLTPRTSWWGVLRDATMDVFSTMVNAKVEVPHAQDDFMIAPEPTDSSVLAYLTGTIGIAGAMRAIFSLRCSETVATHIASQMLGITPEEAVAQRVDAIGEVCNIIAGHFKHKIGLGETCSLSVPTVIVGGHYKIHCLAAGERIEFPVIYNGETVLVTLDIRE
jgi:chemotaxis protein CheX